MTHEDEGSTDHGTSKSGLQVLIFNLKARLNDTSQIFHQYATHSKGEPPMPSLSTTAGMGSTGLSEAQP